MTSVDEIWGSVCEKLRETLMPPIYKVWITPLSLVSFDGRAVDIVASEMAQKVLRQQCYNELLEAFRETVGFDVEINFITEAQASAESSEEAEEELLDEEEKCTFDNFVVGPSNRFAHAAALAVANEPVVRYNPLFIYGDSGLGKTHLLCAISNAVKEKNPDAKIIFTGGERFMNQIITGIRDHNMEAIHEQYRNCDVLLVDDIQFIAGKESTQEEFFHTFNSLHDAHKQIVIASDRPAKEIKSLEERLRTRFEWGLTADVQPPDFETRVAIVKRKAELLHLDLPEDVAEFIANHLKNNIRQLEGAVKKLNAYYMLEGIAPCIGVTTTAIKDTLNDTQPIPVTIEKIINEVARTYNVIPSDIRGKKRSANVSAARQMSMYIIREITGMSMEAIGSEFQRDHSTVVYSINTMEKNIGKDRHLKETVDDIMKNIRA